MRAGAFLFGFVPPASGPNRFTKAYPRSPRFAQELPLPLAKQDFVDSLPPRRRALVERDPDRFRGRRVLDLAAHVGDLTSAIAGLAAEVVALEGNPACVEVLYERFDGTNVTVVEADVHRALWKFEPDRFDLVFCAGFLYHTAHPFYVLEGIARLRPSTVLIDTLNADVPPASISIVEEKELNRYNYRYNTEPDCGFSLVLGDALIDATMARLGYRIAGRIEKGDLTLPAEKDNDYFRRWKASLSAWYEREEARGTEEDEEAPGPAEARNALQKERVERDADA